MTVNRQVLMHNWLCAIVDEFVAEERCTYQAGLCETIEETVTCSPSYEKAESDLDAKGDADAIDTLDAAKDLLRAMPRYFHPGNKAQLDHGHYWAYPSGGFNERTLGQVRELVEAYDQRAMALAFLFAMNEHGDL